MCKFSPYDDLGTILFHMCYTLGIAYNFPSFVSIYIPQANDKETREDVFNRIIDNLVDGNEEELLEGSDRQLTCEEISKILNFLRDNYELFNRLRSLCCINVPGFCKEHKEFLCQCEKCNHTTFNQMWDSSHLCLHCKTTCSPEPWPSPISPRPKRKRGPEAFNGANFLVFNKTKQQVQLFNFDQTQVIVLPRISQLFAWQVLRTDSFDPAVFNGMFVFLLFSLFTNFYLFSHS